MEEESVSIQDYIDAVLRRWWILLIGTVLAGAAAIGLGLHSSPSAAKVHQYEATTVALMEGAEVVTGFPGLAETGIVLEDVIGDLGLSLSVSQLKGKVSATSLVDTPLLQIKVKDPDPALAVAIADGVASSLVDHVSALQQARSAAVQEQLSAQLGEQASADSTGPNEGLVNALVPLARRPYEYLLLKFQKD